MEPTLGLDFSRERLRALVRLAESVGWRQTIDREIDSPVLRRYVLGRGSADFQYVWEAPHDASVLHLGAEWGSVAAELAPNFARVVAATGVPERARLMEIRFREMNVSARVVCASPLQLPFAGSQFDAVVLSSGNRDCSRLLCAARELLKSRGFLCVTSENRWALISDPEYRVARRPQRAGSLSYWHRLLENDGFRIVQEFHVWHGCRNSSILVPLRNRAALQWFIEHKGGLTVSGWKGRLKTAGLRAAARTGLWAYGAADFLFLAVKN